MDLAVQMKPYDLMPNLNPFLPPSTLWLCCVICLHSSTGSFHNNSSFHAPRGETLAGEKSLSRADPLYHIHRIRMPIPEPIAVA